MSSSDFDPIETDPPESGTTLAAQDGADSSLESETKSELDKSTPT